MCWKEAKERQSLPLKEQYAVVFLVVCKASVYALIGVDMDGNKVLYVGVSESTKYWLSVLNEIKTGGVREIFIFCRDNLAGIKDAIKAAYANSDQ